MGCTEPELAVPLRRALSRQFKHALDEFSLTIGRLEPTPHGCRVHGRFHVYAGGTFRFAGELRPPATLHGFTCTRIEA
jgi:hypothetical protein